MHLNWLCCRLHQREREREKEREKRERKRICVLMIIEFDNSMFIGVTKLIDQEERKECITCPSLSLSLSLSLSNMNVVEYSNFLIHKEITEEQRDRNH